jgi:hypothetical protein
MTQISSLTQSSACAVHSLTRPRLKSAVALQADRASTFAGQEWADDSRVIDYIGLLLGTGVLETAKFQVLVAS